MDMWKHRKTGKHYELVGFCVIENGCIPAVIYTPVEGTGEIWVRPCEEFFDGRFLQSPGPTRTVKINIGGVGIEDAVEALKGYPTPEDGHPQVAKRDTQVIPPKK